MVNQDIINIIKVYLNKLIIKGLIIQKAILYGSFSRNEETESSDIDLMIISPDFDIDIDKFTPKVWLTAADIDFRIEPYMVGSKRFEEDNVSPIIQIAKQEGIEIEF
jgi:uncharacterized protein